MLKFFKKDNSQKTKEIAELALCVFRIMHPKHEYIVNQLKEGSIRGLKKESASFENYTGFSLDVKILNKYEKKKGPVFVVKGITVYDTFLNGFTEIRFYIGYGLLLGFSTPSIKEVHPDISKVDVNQCYCEFFENTDYETIKPLLTKEEVELVNPNDVYEVPLDGKIFYHIQDLEDGDFIGIDKKKNVYKITHDPYLITKLNESLSEILH